MNYDSEKETKWPALPTLYAIMINEIREKQRQEGYSDCFGRASSGHCDQKGCSYYKKCMDVSHALASLNAPQGE